jgi:hypothetical protein
MLMKSTNGRNGGIEERARQKTIETSFGRRNKDVVIVGLDFKGKKKERKGLLRNLQFLKKPT